jgi:hypothetical protein
MTVNMFLILLSAFSVLSGLITEGIKNLLDDKKNLSCNLLALCVALIVGVVGCGVYYQLRGIPFDVNNVIYMILLGLASGLGSMVGYDKVKQTIEQLVITEK